MKISRTNAWCLAILSGIAATMVSMPSSQAAKPKVCPQFVTDYCVVNKDGYRHTEATNPCFAKQRGQRVLHIGACEGPICPFVVLPVCSINPDTHKQQTYSNLCLSDAANATLVHKGACRGKK
jgi:hypothetical protein